MKLILDQNLSYRLNDVLRGLGLESVHVAALGLSQATDQVLWQVGRDEQACLVTKDTDFHEMSVLYGQPPKVIWLRRGNCSTQELAQLMQSHGSRIIDFLYDESSAILVIT